MPRYIDADALKAKYEQMIPEIGDGYHKETLQDVLFELEYATTISPDEVRGVGHWVTEQEAIDANDYSLRDTCSVCGRCDWDCTESASFKYCPNCGARMEVSEDA